MKKKEILAKDKYAVFHYVNGYNTNRKDECDVDDWFKARRHVYDNPRVLQALQRKF